MKMKNVRVLSACLVLTLTGCSHLSPHRLWGGGSEQKDQSAQTHAQTRAQLWEQVDSGDDYVTLQAPHNQTYHFAFDKSHVKTKYVPSIVLQAEYLVEHPKAQVRVEGHTDERGSREYNVALGMRRAKAVARVLKQHGVSPKQLTQVSYGQEKPVALEHNEKAYWQNRRVHLIYTNL